MSAEMLLRAIEEGSALTKTEARFASKVMVDPEGCWLWVGSRSTTGYGIFHADGRNWPAHRWLWLHVKGPLSSELVLDHLCSTRPCVNPSHLEPVTALENMLRGSAISAARAWAASLETCPFGHPYDAENTYITARGARTCRACHRADKKGGPRLSRPGRIRAVRR